jgi:hypothetical protein
MVSLQRAVAVALRVATPGGVGVSAPQLKPLGRATLDVKKTGANVDLVPLLYVAIDFPLIL